MLRSQSGNEASASLLLSLGTRLVLCSQSGNKASASLLRSLGTRLVLAVSSVWE